jgi:hypothetical protein
MVTEGERSLGIVEERDQGEGCMAEMVLRDGIERIWIQAEKGFHAWHSGPVVCVSQILAGEEEVEGVYKANLRWEEGRWARAENEIPKKLRLAVRRLVGQARGRWE